MYVRSWSNKRIVVLNAVACWAAFHVCNSCRELAFFPANGLATTRKLTVALLRQANALDQISKARIVAQWIHERINI